jgi:predicted permease
LALGKSRKVDVTNKNTEELAVPVLRRWCCVSIARFALSPSIMIFLLTLLEKGNLIGSINGEDAMTWFMLILAACMPSAQNSVIMLQVADQTDEASRLAKFLFSMYATSMIPVMLAATIMLDKCNFMTSL